MNKKICKIIIIILIILAIILGIMYLIDLDRMKNGRPVVFSTWGSKYAPFLVEIENNDYQKYTKTIDNVTLELNIPNEWNYKEIARNEENDFYKYALKLYKNNENQFVTLYIDDTPFSVCGTGLTTKNLILNNRQEANIGYFDENIRWWYYISFHKNPNIVVLNDSDLTNEDAEEVIEIIKTINITNEQDLYSFCGTITKVENNLFFVRLDENEEIRKSADLVMVGKLQIDSNVKFEIGERVKITYDGDIMETYPLQIKAIKYERID